MYAWCFLLFVLGVLAFLDALFNMGQIFRHVNSVLFMLVSLALLVRTATKSKAARKEQMEERMFDLEKKVASMKRERKVYQDS